MNKCILIPLMVVFNSCIGQNDKDLKSPDKDILGYTHGNNLTLQGMLQRAPWQYDNFFVGAINSIVFLNDENIPLGGFIPYSENEKNIEFTLKQDGKLEYWFNQTDSTLQALADTTSKHHKIDDSRKELKIYTIGFWTFNSKDSSIEIDFGVNDMKLLPIKGKIITLTSTRMELEQTSFFEGIYKGRKERLKKKLISYFCHQQALF